MSNAELTHELRVSVIATQESNLKVLFSRNKCVSPIMDKLTEYPKLIRRILSDLVVCQTLK